MTKKPRQTPEEKTLIAELRGCYGGMMTLADICTEISRTRDVAKRWVHNVQLSYIDINGRPSYRTSDVALAIEAGRMPAH